MIGAREQGRVRGIGVSNYSTEQIDRLAAATGVMPAVNQIRWSPALFGPGRIAQMRDGIVVLPRSVRPDRIRENFSVWDFELTQAELALIDAMGSAT